MKIFIKIYFIHGKKIKVNSKNNNNTFELNNNKMNTSKNKPEIIIINSDRKNKQLILMILKVRKNKRLFIVNIVA